MLLRIAPQRKGCEPRRMVDDGQLDVRNYPLVHNHHHVTFFGDHRQELLDFCRLAKIQPVVV